MPSTFEPKPWGWYPVPGKPSDVLQKIDIPDLSESLDEMAYITSMTEKATGATATQQGVETAQRTTLGEVQLAQGEAKARTQGMSKFYTDAWKKRATKFLKLIEAASDKLDAVKIYKKGKNTDEIFAREIKPSDWMTKAGYRVKVWSQDEKKANDTDSLRKLQIMKLEMFDNPKVQEIYKRKLTEFADLTPDEVMEIMEFEKQKAGMLGMGMLQPQIGANGQPVPPLPAQQQQQVQI